MTDFEFLAETFKPLRKNNEKILLPAEGLNFEETLQKNRYIEIENKTKYPALTFAKKMDTKEYFYFKGWEGDKLSLIKLDAEPNRDNFDPKNYN